MNGTYIFIGDISDYISGAPIYQRNKALYLNEIGWKVIILPLKRGRVYIKDVSQFAVGSFPFLRCRPSDLRHEDLEECLDTLIGCIGDVEGPCVVETGTDWAAYWGELLAERLSAKHFLFLLDETNEHIESYPDFFWWKYQRGEMVGINDDVIENLFQGRCSLAGKLTQSFKAYCSNSVEDYYWDGSNNWKYWDFNIGSIGRLDKIFVEQIVSALKNLASSFPNIIFGVYFYGGASESAERKILSEFKGINNINVYITGYLWPLPLDLLSRMQVFVGGAGSVQIPDALGIPSLCMDVLGRGCIGFFDELKNQCLSTMVLSKKGHVVDLKMQLERVLNGEKAQQIRKFNSSADWKVFSKEYARQVNYVLSLNADGEYWSDLNKIPGKRNVIKLLLRFLGVERFLWVRSLIMNEPNSSIDSMLWSETCR